MSKKQSGYSKMIKTAIFAFATFFVGAGIFFVPKNFETNNAITTSKSFNAEAPVSEQARMLLRKVGLTGKVSSELPILDSTFAA